MGKHYVPQRYLRGFEVPKEEKTIWMFDKLLKTSRKLPVKIVAQEADFYDGTTEKMLNEVEIRGNNVLDKVCQGGQMTATERDDFAYYVATMISRVPHARNIGLSLLPESLSETITKIRGEIEEAARQRIISEERRRALLIEVEASEKKLSTEPPMEMIKRMTEPWPFESWLYAVTSMQWRILRTKGPTLFLTSDNPASSFECYGLGNAQSELLFPLKSDYLFHGCYQRERSSGIMEATQQHVKSANRRIAFNATRFIFYHEEAKWLNEVIKNKIEQLDRFGWN